MGVYATSRLAARAYNVVQEYLHSYRTEHKITKDTPKDELHAVFNEARRIAHEAVQILRRDLRIKEGVDDDEGEDIADFTIDESKMEDFRTLLNRFDSSIWGCPNTDALAVT